MAAVTLAALGGAASVAGGALEARGTPGPSPGQRAAVVMTGARCGVSSRAPLVEGGVRFEIRNRSSRPRRFGIAGRRTRFVAPSRTAGLFVNLRAGRHLFTCAVSGRRATVQTGVLRVRPAPRIVYASDWSGTFQVYAADPSGRARTGQLTFGPAPSCLPANPCGFVQALPSPDGRRVLFSDHVEQGIWRRALFVARADGRGRRRIATVDDFRIAAVWSPDSRRIAYWGGGSLRTTTADGARERSVVSTDRVWSVAWSPNGRWLAYRSPRLHVVRPDGTGSRIVSGIATSFSWSPDGRRLAFAEGGVRIADPATGEVRILVADDAVRAVAWSPGARLVAYATDTAVRVADASTGQTHRLSDDPLAIDSPLAWSPDGRLLAYLRSGGSSFFPTTDLRVVGLNGDPRTVVASDGRFGGAIQGVAWASPPAVIRYRPAAPRSLASISADELTAPADVTQLATDGGRVAYVSCGHVFLWTPARRTVEQAEPQASLSPRCPGPTYSPARGVYTVGLAGERVAFGLIGGGNTTNWWLGGTSTARPATHFTLGVGLATTGGPRDGFVGDLAGSGDLLVFSSRRQLWADGRCCTLETTRQEVIRVEASGCPCTPLAAEPGPFVPNDVDGGRIAAVGDYAVVLLDRDGDRLLTVPVRARAARLAGDDLVVALDAELRRYDARTGELLATRPIEGGLALEDAARGLAAYTLGGDLHVLRLGDGTQTAIGRATTARFLDEGLAYADGARIRIVRFDQLERR